jgi:hypothetical protein
LYALYHLRRVGDQLRDQQFKDVCGCLQAPFPEHLAGVQPGAGHRAGQRAKLLASVVGLREDGECEVWLVSGHDPDVWLPEGLDGVLAAGGYGPVAEVGAP